MHRLLTLTARKSRVLVKLKLRLPWKPKLTWLWGVKHVFGDDGVRIVEHIEDWEIDAMKGLRMVSSRAERRSCGW